MIDEAESKVWIGPYSLERWNEWAKQIVHDQVHSLTVENLNLIKLSSNPRECRGAEESVAVGEGVVEAKRRLRWDS